MGRLKRLLTDAENGYAGRMASLGFTMEQVAFVLGVSKDSLERRRNESEDLRESIRTGRSVAAAQVISTAFELAISGKCPAMTMFWLKTRCGWRERAPAANTPMAFTLNYERRQLESDL